MASKMGIFGPLVLIYSIAIYFTKGIRTALPNQKKRFYNLYENELGCDVILLVGESGCQERIPAHTWVLSSGSDYFRALFCYPLDKSSTKEYSFPDDATNGFNNLIRWLYQNKCDLQSLQSSLETLQTAIKYLCPDLAVACVDQITKQLDVKNVLKVIQNIQWYSTYSPPPVVSCEGGGLDSPTPSAPSLEDLDDQNCPDSVSIESVIDPTVCCQQLFNECLEIVDKNGDQVLNSEHFTSSNEALIKMVVKRSTLKVTSEMDIFRALHRWSTAVCKRQHYPLTLESRRNVLGSTLFQARLLTLPFQELEASKADLLLLLTDEEQNYIMSCVKIGSTSPKMAVPPTLLEHLTLLSTPRLDSPSDASKNQQLDTKSKKKFGFKKRFNKKELILDLVSVLAMIFD